ncbi:hypothetical protein DA096_10745 [Vibrio rotiferianus]|uniref:Uncharacterized protein n=1 Tax=Vibrio owensii TaxID=696485 RepID=A0AAU9Q9N5_9VIBR|nr:hypothetical protein [Vibrio rotiferianus]TMX33561.1 hypothetical protein DA095_17900 [Vibrio rotiferianus]TMX48170.1 hypothetical protein DA093_16545 [Vibrio rotiferianus]TMX64229.1 hypothetical protein DA096_10745 [Vibrio rotiferianus]CAH1537746.1 conserved hypothetical protein [Vibrio owensii]
MKDFRLNIDIEATYGRNNEDGLIISLEGKSIKETEAIYSVGTYVYEHLEDLHKSEANEHSSINSFIEEKINFVIDLYRSLLIQLSEHNKFIISLPDERELVGTTLKEYAKSSSSENILHVGQFVQRMLAEEMDVHIIPWHESGYQAIMFIWEVNRSVDEHFQYHEPSFMLEILNDCWLHREKMSNVIFAGTNRKESARKAAKSRHAETDSMKKEVLKIYDKNKDTYRSVADAARKLSRVVPVTDRTIDKWIRQNKKS